MRIYFVIFYLIFTSCQHTSEGKHITITTNLSLADTTKTINQDTLKILCYGEKTPDLYANVQHIIEKKYTIKFIDVAGCEVTGKLIDSVKKCNNETYKQLNKRYNRDIELEINNSLSAEYTYLNELDSYLRKTQKKENTTMLIYFVKKQYTYKAYYLFGDPDYKILNYRLKSVLEIDSVTKQIISRTKKDEIQPYNLKLLQNLE